jgi:hypothetical protein
MRTVRPSPVEVPGGVERSELPIPDYDHLPEGSLVHRVRALDEGDLRRLLDHEREHGNRTPVVTMLEQRLDALRSGAAVPSSGDPAAAQPERAPAAQGGSAANPDRAQANNQPLREGLAGQTPNRDIRGR